MNTDNYIVHTSKAAGANPYPSFTIDNVLGFPDAFPADTTSVDIEVNLSFGNIDLTGWKPTGLIDQTIVRIEKVSDSNKVLSWTNDRGFKYSFLNKNGEVLTLKWVEAINNFKVI